MVFMFHAEMKKIKYNKNNRMPYKHRLYGDQQHMQRMYMIHLPFLLIFLSI